MSPVAMLALLGWVPVVLYIFTRFPAQRAVVISFIVAWLFLPIADFVLPAIPDLTKMSATCYGILLATIIFDVGRITSFQPGWLDLPMLIFCCSPFLSSIDNGLGWYDGVSQSLEKIVSWGIPYFLGRIYLNNLTGLRQLAIGIFIGGLAYAPLCLLETRISPQLHRMVYGSHAVPGQFGQTIRYGGFRPTVFMKHGLEVGMWMMAAALVGIWLWRTGALKKLWNIQIKWLVIFLIITVILVKSTGAYFLLAFGFILLLLCHRLGTALPILLLSILACLYLYQSAYTETYITDQIVAGMSQVANEERMQSLEFRFNNEELLSDHARKRIIFGWGGWGRAQLYDQDGEQISISDSLWIVVFGNMGSVGLISIFCSLILPFMSLFLSHCPGRSWTKREVAPAAVLGVILFLYMVDCLLNAFVNPVFILTNGAIAGYVLKGPEPKRIRKVQRVASQRSLPRRRQQSA
ncbi:MAG: O-antigen ligase domain-containing protein [Symploca sp. SIO2E6]|nr:O-antigen ligase domain-containing protein [Symploca sp. SIO2E6]